MAIPQTHSESLTLLTLDAERESSSDHLVPIHVSRGSHAGSESCHSNRRRFLEVTVGFEPVTYNAFAERPLKPLEYVTK